jgi:hypothetical protein
VALAAKGSCSIIRGEEVASDKLFLGLLGFWRELRTLAGVCAGAGTGADAGCGGGESVGVPDRKEGCGGTGALREGIDAVGFADSTVVPARRAEYSWIDAFVGIWYSTVFD